MTFTASTGRGAPGYPMRLKTKDGSARSRYEQAEPKAVYFPASSPLQQAANAKLEAYLRYSPSGERDVSKELDRLERQRGTWLRDVLDCCED